MKNTVKMLLASMMLISMLGCDSGKGTTTPGTSDYDFTAILKSSVGHVIVPTYKDLAGAADTLYQAIVALEKNTTSANLEAARDAWVSARVPWEQSEAFIFGPVSDLGLDPALDSWPVDHVQLDQVLESGLALSSDTITENLGGGLKGFHTIEYLLWGNHSKKAADFKAKPREMEYLVAVSEALKNDATTLWESWTKEKYGESFYLAGQEGARYSSQVDAVQQLVNGMIDICDEVGNGKIGDPYNEKDVTLVESQFSYNSIRDFTNNIRSVQNIYTGSYNDQNGLGLAVFVAEKDSALDGRVKAEIKTAIDAIKAIVDGEPFKDAITDSAKATQIEAAQEAISIVMNTMSGPVMQLLFK